MFKKLCLLSLLSITVNTHAGSLIDFDHISQSIDEGNGIRVRIDLGQCSINKSMGAGNVGVVEPNAFILIKDKYLTFADLHFTTHHPAHQNKAIYEDNKFILKPDNTFVMTSQALDAKTFEPIGELLKVECILNEGVRVYPKA